MSRTFTRRKWLTAAAVLAVLTVFWLVSHGPTPAQAQTGFFSSSSPFVRAFNFGPVTLAPGQSLSVSYSNLFGARAFRVKARFFDASTGKQIGSAQEAEVPPGQVFEPTVIPSPNQPPLQTSSLAVQASGFLKVVGVLELADPRPTPLVSLQILGSNGQLVALADPRPTPLADPRPTP